MALTKLFRGLLLGMFLVFPVATQTEIRSIPLTLDFNRDEYDDVICVEPTYPNQIYIYANLGRLRRVASTPVGWDPTVYFLSGRPAAQENVLAVFLTRYDQNSNYPIPSLRVFTVQIDAPHLAEVQNVAIPLTLWRGHNHLNSIDSIAELFIVPLGRDTDGDGLLDFACFWREVYNGFGGLQPSLVEMAYFRAFLSTRYGLLGMDRVNALPTDSMNGGSLVGAMEYDSPDTTIEQEFLVHGYEVRTSFRREASRNFYWMFDQDLNLVGQKVDEDFPLPGNYGEIDPFRPPMALGKFLARVDSLSVPTSIPGGVAPEGYVSYGLDPSRPFVGRPLSAFRMPMGVTTNIMPGVTADFNGDGIEEIGISVFPGRFLPQHMLLLNPALPFQRPSLYGEIVAPGYQEITVGMWTIGDFDADGDVDIFMKAFVPGRVNDILWENLSIPTHIRGRFVNLQ